VVDELAGPFPQVSREFGSPAEVDAAVDKLQRRVSSLEQLDINPVFNVRRRNSLLSSKRSK
jgi:hypothetical protein